MFSKTWFINELCNPLYVPENQGKRYAINHYLVLNIIFISIMLLLFQFTTLLTKYNLIGIQDISPRVSETSLIAFITSYPYRLTIVFIPPLEEFLFRWGLLFSPLRFSVLLLGLFSEIIGIFFLRQSNNFMEDKILMPLLFFFIFWLLFWYISYNYRKIILSNWNKYFNLIFWSSIILFAYSHFSKYQITDFTLAIIFSPVLLLPYIISGYLFSLVRIRFGILWSILSHSLANFSSALVYFYLG